MRIENIPASDTMELRHRVLWPDKPLEQCLIEGDESATHYGIFNDQKLVGVEKQFQGKGFGSALLAHSISKAQSGGRPIFGVTHVKMLLKYTSGMD